jgi:CRISPR system Cascade subunit CasD
MASWGDIAVGEYRPSFSHPTKSAIIGLIEAALGIDRSDEQAHQEMTKSYGFAVRVDAPGALLRDYHTIQVPQSTKNAFYVTRKEELEAEKQGTTLSYRDYYCDTLSISCVWAKGESQPYPLESIKAALESPRFPLYLGRKSCPPSLPLAPRVMEATTLMDALNQYLALQPNSEADLLQGLSKGQFIGLYWEELSEGDVGRKADRTVRRRDVPMNRGAWQFSDRKEYAATFSQVEGV